MHNIGDEYSLRKRYNKNMLLILITDPDPNAGKQICIYGPGNSRASVWKIDSNGYGIIKRRIALIELGVSPSRLLIWYLMRAFITLEILFSILIVEKQISNGISLLKVT